MSNALAAARSAVIAAVLIAGLIVALLVGGALVASFASAALGLGEMSCERAGGTVAWESDLRNGTAYGVCQLP